MIIVEFIDTTPLIFHNLHCRLIGYTIQLDDNIILIKTNIYCLDYKIS